MLKKRATLLLAGFSLVFVGCFGGEEPAPAPVAPPVAETQPANSDPVEPAMPVSEEAPPKAPTAAANGDLVYVTDDAIAALLVHPKRMYESTLVSKVIADVGVEEMLQAQTDEFQQNAGFDWRTLERVLVVVDQGQLDALTSGEVDDEPKASSTVNNLKQVGLAFHNYHDTWNGFPRADGPFEPNPDLPAELLSWRVHLLPFLGEAELYNQFHMNEAWDSEHNKTLIEKMPDVFKTSGVTEAGNTSFHVFVGEGTPFVGEKGPRIRNFTDGTSNTILCVVAGADAADVWTKPGGLEFDAEKPKAALGELPTEGIRALGSDGAVHTLPADISDETLAYLIQPADGNVVNWGPSPEALELERSGPGNSPLDFADFNTMPTAILTFSVPVQTAIVEKLGGEAETKSHANKEYLARQGERGVGGIYFPNPQTVVVSRESRIQYLLESGWADEGTSIRKQLQGAPDADVVLAVEMGSVLRGVTEIAGPNPFLGPFMNLESALIALNVTAPAGDPLLEIRTIAKSEEAAENLSLMLQGMLEQGKEMLALQEAPIPPAAQKIVEEAAIDREGAEISFVIKTPPQFVEEVSMALSSAFAEAQKAAKGAQDRNNLRQIGLAFHNYHDIYGRLPQADGPGEPTEERPAGGLSWRVYLLPLLDQPALAEKFKYDEPWDSEHNKQFIEKMPKVFETPGVTEPGKTSLHVFTGKGTMFPGEGGTTFSSITDGLSNTILVVSAGADTAEIWTKPGGLEFDAEDPIAALGEILEAGFLALISDGSVRTIPATIDKETLGHLIQIDDGQVVEIP